MKAPTSSLSTSSWLYKIINKDTFESILDNYTRSMCTNDYPNSRFVFVDKSF